MAGSGEIKAGRAAVEGTFRDGITKSLGRIQGRFKGFAAALKPISASLSKFGAGALISEAFSTAGLAASVAGFAKAGSQLNDLSERTGMTVEALSKLKYAAGLTGTDLEGIEKGAKGVEKFMGKLANGGEEAEKTLHHLGVSAASLKGLNPDQLFETLAKAVGKVQDPTMRAALAMQVFGKTGTDLTELLVNFDQLTGEAEKLGFVMSTEAARNADKLDDALFRLGASSKGIFSAIGGIAAAGITTVVEHVTEVAIAIRNWIRKNKELVGTILRVAAVGAAIGAAIAAIAGAVAIAGMAFGGLASAAALVAGVLGAVFSPIGLITSALVAGGYAWSQYTESGRKAMEAIKNFMGPILQIVQDTFTGIKDAISAGDLSLAGKILIAGLKAVLLEGVASLADAVKGALGDFIGTLGTQIAGGDFSGAWSTTIDGMKTVWTVFCSTLTEAFTASAKAVLDAWRSTVGMISDKILELQGLINKLANISPSAVAQSVSDAITSIKPADVGNALWHALPGVGIAEILTSDPLGLGQGVDLAAEQKRRDKLNAQAAAMGLATDSRSVVDEAKDTAREIVAGMGAGVTTALDGMEQAAHDHAAAAVAELGNSTTNGAGAAGVAAAQARRELDALRQQAAALAPLDFKGAGVAKPGAGLDALDGIEHAKSIGTFSASAAGRLGGGGPLQRIADSNDRIEKNTRGLKGRVIVFAA